MKKSFLELVAETIIALKSDAIETAIILPNKRSAVFLKDILKQNIQNPFWLPEFYSLDSFLQEASGFTKADPLQLSLDLYGIHQKIGGNEQRSMEDFLSWAPIIVSDFNDVDLNLADASQLFQHLSANKAIQEWNLDGRPLTTMQQSYLNFYRSLLKYYQLLRDQLIKNKQGYPGLIYRHLAENFAQYSPQWPWKRLLVAGINALSPAETLFFSQLTKHYPVDFLWDVDGYYFDSDHQKAINPEPGRFIKGFLQQLNLPQPSTVENLLLTDDKTIDFVGIQGEIAQTKYVAQWLSEQLASLPLDQSQLRKTAIVLADEQLLVPLLDALPVINDQNKAENRYNITMGYPLKNSAIEMIVQQWAKLLQHREQTDGSTLTLPLTSFLNNPLVKLVFNQIQPRFTQNLCKNLIADNIYSLSKAELTEQLKDASEGAVTMLNTLLTASDGIRFITNFQQLLQQVHELKKQHSEDPLELHQLTKALEVTASLKRILEQNKEQISLKTAEKILLQFIRRAQVHLVGEPLEGIQIMGLLETRNLDFDRILFLSCNEGFLPASDQMETFIPFDIRHQFKMPLPKDSQDVTAYHFYRLLQRVKHITYAYNSSTAGLGSNDESRFLLQLENELATRNKHLQIRRKQLNLAVDTRLHQNTIEVNKTETTLTTLREKGERGFSPSALNTFIICPLRFYYRYALSVWPEDKLEQSMESNTFGSIVHGALENIYKPLEGKPMDPGFLQERLKMSSIFLEAEYRKIFKGTTSIKGKNLLMMEVSKNMVNQTILNDCRALEKDPRLLISVEKKVQTTIETRHGKIRLEGTIDRVDKSLDGNQVRVIDYKTGRVLPKNLKVDALESLVTNPDLAKAFQLMQYALMFNEENQQVTDIIAGNISLRNLSQGFVGPVFTDETKISDNLPLFKILLTGLLEQIMDPVLTFKQTEDPEACRYCDYRQICNRN